MEHETLGKFICACDRKYFSFHFGMPCLIFTAEIRQRDEKYTDIIAECIEPIDHSLQTSSAQNYYLFGAQSPAYFWNSRDSIARRMKKITSRSWYFSCGLSLLNHSVRSAVRCTNTKKNQSNGEHITLNRKQRRAMHIHRVADFHEWIDAIAALVQQHRHLTYTEFKDMPFSFCQDDLYWK